VRQELIDLLMENTDISVLEELLEVARGSAKDDISDDSDAEEYVADAEPAVVGAPNLHPPVAHTSLHCPPFNDITPTLGDSLCDCYKYGELFDPCCRQWGQYDAIDWDAQMRYSARNINDHTRPTNNIMRKHLYLKVYRQCNVGDEREVRTELSVCAVAKVRQLFPSSSGDYMGFLYS